MYIFLLKKLKNMCKYIHIYIAKIINDGQKNSKQIKFVIFRSFAPSKIPIILEYINELKKNKHQLNIGQIIKKSNGKYLSILSSKEKLLKAKWHAIGGIIIFVNTYQYYIQLDSNGSHIENSPMLNCNKNQWNIKELKINIPRINKSVIFDIDKNSELILGSCVGMSYTLSILIYEWLNDLKNLLPLYNDKISKIGTFWRKKNKIKLRREIDNIIKPIVVDLEKYLNKKLPQLVNGNEYWSNLCQSNIWVKLQTSKGFDPTSKNSIFIYIY